MGSILTYMPVRKNEYYGLKKCFYIAMRLLIYDSMRSSESLLLFYLNRCFGGKTMLLA